MKPKIRFLKASQSVIFALGLMLLSSGCASLQRSSASGYDSPGARDLGRDSSDLVGDTPYLTRVEQALEGRREREQYFKNKPYMRSNEERLAFLRLSSFEERTAWLAANGISGPTTPPSSEIQALVDINDVTVGMTKQAVRDSWGEPELVEVAGNPLYGNERWAYSEQIPSTDGFKTERRTIYFESGRVAGWQSR